MKTIVRIKFGSHLYGTSTPASDLDFKSVHVPSARDILLQRVASSVSTKREKSHGEKNYAGEVEEESYSLQRYLGLLADGHPVSLDMLFAPGFSQAQAATSEWDQIYANRHRLLTRKHAAFVTYCRTQANKYGIKGSRVAAARKALALLTKAMGDLGTHAKLSGIAGAVATMCSETEHMSMSGDAMTVLYWNVCGRKLGFTSSIMQARDVMQRLVDEYGHRALQAEQQQGVDWKALSHAVRVATQALEVLSTGHVTFPRPDAAHILAIKTGELPYQQVGEEIERLLVEVEAAAKTSLLLDEPDRKWIDDFIAGVHYDEVNRNG